MRKRALIFLLSVLTLAVSCIREGLPTRMAVPEGTPVTITLGFGATTPVEVSVGTKAEASDADEARVHDLYVLIFNAEGKRHYGRYFNYEQRWSDIADLNNTTNEREGWYVANKTLDGVNNPVAKTTGAVKIATSAKTNCTLVLLANVSNTLVSLDGKAPLTVLNDLSLTLDDLRTLPVQLKQNAVERNDLFLMEGEIHVDDMSGMKWTDDAAKVTLSPIDAKVKFRVRGGDHVKNLEPNKWSVTNVPSSCALLPLPSTSYTAPTSFNTALAYFDGEEEEIISGKPVKWKTFTFYMLESCLVPENPIQNASVASSYYLREKRVSTDGDWQYAPKKAPYVNFSISMVLDDTAIANLDDWTPEDIPHAATGEMSYTVHLGNFSSGPDANNYETKRGHFYTYNIVLENAKSLYVEVKDDTESQPGQEGILQLYSGSVVNCDAHYEYQMIEFKYNDQLNLNNPVYSWHVKTPFTEDGGPTWNSVKGFYEVDGKMDYLWVKFAVNELVNGSYSKNRVPYPGEDKYDEAWYPGKAGDVPLLMDINQLINFIFYQHRQKKAGETDIFDGDDIIRVTAFVDEYYYERDPITGSFSPELWRTFVNADPREMHILSNLTPSSDNRSFVVDASHSIIQTSIQSIYNTNSPELTSIWGTEHEDEILEKKDWDGWGWINSALPIDANYTKDFDNGRLNSAALWGLYPSTGAKSWSTFLDYAVENNIPELTGDYRKMAYSCLTRNRDNNGNGTIDLEEVRWYMASINQLKAMWVGNESLSTSARIYQPNPRVANEWRAHVISSTCQENANQPKVLRAEEGVSTFDHNDTSKAEQRRESVRCVRNVGTFTELGKTSDITSAPLDTIPNNFYTLQTKKDPEHPFDAEYNSYVIRFNRLDSRSLREFTDTELPFNDEKSSNNRVYLELHVPSSASNSSKPDKDMGEINVDITDKGYNEYCPVGYRLPNQTELAMMTLVIPSIYFFGNDTRFPSRTYYSHGKYGSKNPSSEQNKLGWTYTFSANNHGNLVLSTNGQKTTAVRCVRDNDRTGAISGSMYLTNSFLLPGEETTLHFNFSSASVDFTSGSLYLRYADNEGNTREKAIPLATPLSGMEYRESQSFSVNPETLEGGLTLPAQMQLKLVMSNSRGVTETAVYPFTVTNMGVICEFTIKPGSDITLDKAGKEISYPLEVYAKTLGKNSDMTDETITSLKILWKRAGETGWQTIPIDDAVGQTEFLKTVNFTIPSNDNLDTYIFKAVAESSTNKSDETKPQSMQFILDWDKCFNVEDPSHPWVWSTDFEGKWPAQEISGIDFEAGDFLEVCMDLTNCVYRPLPSSVVEGLTWPYTDKYGKEHKSATNQFYKDYNLGIDELFAVGMDANIGNKGQGRPFDPGYSDVFHVFYPARENNEDRLRISFVTGNNVWNSINISALKQTVPLTFRLSKDGYFWNGIALDMSQFITAQWTVHSKILASHTLYIGSIEGYHRSRAKYKYVRVVRKNLDDTWSNGTGGFNENPQPGGNL